MPNSARFALLESRLVELRERLLPQVLPSPTGVYSDAEVDCARGYRLLVHAEFEAFIEDRVTETAKAALTSWKSSATLSRPLLGLLAYSQPATAFPDRVPPRGRRTDLESRLDQALANLNSIVDNNHGIRSANLAKLLFSAGIQESDINSFWVTNMDNFGQKRGDVAHRSTHGTKSIAPTVNPHDEYIHVTTELLPGLRSLDDVLIGFAVP